MWSRRRRKAAMMTWFIYPINIISKFRNITSVSELICHLRIHFSTRCCSWTDAFKETRKWLSRYRKKAFSQCDLAKSCVVWSNRQFLLVVATARGRWRMFLTTANCEYHHGWWCILAKQSNQGHLCRISRCSSSLACSNNRTTLPLFLLSFSSFSFYWVKCLPL